MSFSGNRLFVGRGMEGSASGARDPTPMALQLWPRSPHWLVQSSRPRQCFRGAFRTCLLRLCSHALIRHRTGRARGQRFSLAFTALLAERIDRGGAVACFAQGRVAVVFRAPAAACTACCRGRLLHRLVPRGIMSLLLCHCFVCSALGRFGRKPAVSCLSLWRQAVRRQRHGRRRVRRAGPNAEGLTAVASVATLAGALQPPSAVLAELVDAVSGRGAPETALEQARTSVFVA